MLDGFLVIFIAVAIPAYILVWIVGNKRKKESDRQSEVSRVLTGRWMSVLPASSEEKRRAAELAAYHPDDGDVLEEFLPTPDKMAAYYFDTLGLKEDFSAIYGEAWRDKVRIIRDPNSGPMREARAPAAWRIEGFRETEAAEIERAIAAILLSRKGKVSLRSESGVDMSIVVVPNDRKPWAHRWFRRIEENLRTAGHDVDLYVCRKDCEGYKLGAFFAPGPYLVKLDEQEDDDEF